MENEALKEEKVSKHYPSILNVPIELSKSPNIAISIVERSTAGDYVNIYLNQQLVIEHLMLKRGLRFFLRSDGTLESGEELNTSENIVGVLKLDDKGIAFNQVVLPTNAMLKNSAKEEGVVLEEGSKVVLEDNSYLVVGEVKEEYVKVLLHRPEGEVEEFYLEKGGVALAGNTNIADIKAGAEKFEGALVVNEEGKVLFVKAENEMIIDQQGYVLGKPEMFYLDGKMLKEIESEKFIVVTDQYALVFKKERAEEAEEKKVEEAKKEMEKEAESYLIAIAKPEQLKEVIKIIESKAPLEVKIEAVEKLNAELIIIKQEVGKGDAVPVSPPKEGLAERKVGAEGKVQVVEKVVAPDTKVIREGKEMNAFVVEVRKEGLKEVNREKAEGPTIICSEKVFSFLKKNEDYVVKALLAGGPGIARLRKMLGSMIERGFFIFLKG